jgi:hypothetical protein
MKTKNFKIFFLLFASLEVAMASSSNAPDWFNNLSPDRLTQRKISEQRTQYPDSKNPLTPKSKNQSIKCTHDESSRNDESDQDTQWLWTWYQQECIERGKQDEKGCLESRELIKTNALRAMQFSRTVENQTDQTIKSNSLHNAACALDINNFNPAEHHPLKILNSAFFFPRRVNKDPAGNFTQNHDGWGNQGYSATRLSNEVIRVFNHRLANNQRQAWNGETNPLPIPELLPIQIQLRPVSPLVHEVLVPPATTMGPLGVVNGVDPIYFFTSYNLDPIRSYLSPYWFHFSFRNYPDPIPNFTQLPQTPDGEVGKAVAPLNVTTRTGTGYAILDESWSEAGDVQLSYLWKNASPVDNSSVHVHELGHLLGNMHSFGSNGGLQVIWKPKPAGGWIGSNHQCTDISKEDDGTWCGKNNNVMDYNCLANAWSPCQLRVAHYNLTHRLRQRRYLPCRADHQFNHELKGIPGTQFTWDGPQEVIGDLILYPGVTLTINCSVTLAENAKIIKPPSSRIINEHLITRRKCTTNQAFGLKK